MIGIEPCTSWPGHGLATIAETTGTQLRLAPGERRDTALHLHVFTGLSEVTGVANGRAGHGGGISAKPAMKATILKSAYIE